MVTLDTKNFINSSDEKGKKQFNLYHSQYKGEQPIKIEATSRKEAEKIASETHDLRGQIFMCEYRLKYRDSNVVIPNVIAMNEREAKFEAARKYKRQTQQMLSINDLEVEEVHE